MSTILKALHRLERDKDAQVAQPLREQVASASARRRERPSWLVAGATLTAGIAAAAAALLLWAGSGPEAPEAAPGAESEQSESQASVASAQRTEGERSSRASVAERRAKRRAQRAEAKSDRPRPLENASPEAGPSEPPAPSLAALPGGGEAASPEAGSESAGLRPAALASRVELVDRIEAPPAEEPEDREEIAESPPPVVPARLRRAPLPEIFVARTVWHPVAERRVAEVEVRGRPEPLRLREGDAVGPLVVGKIEPSGVVFLHEQVELRRRVGAR